MSRAERKTRGKENRILAHTSIEELMEATDAFVVGLDRDGKIEFVNEALEQVTGFEKGELIGRCWFETLVPADRLPEVEREFKRLLKSGESARYENPILTKSGEEHHVAWRNTVVKEDGKALGTISFGVDLTEHRRIEEDLRDSEEKLLAVFMSAPIAISVSGLKDAILYDVNREFERLFEWTHGEAVGKTALELGLWVDPADRKGVAEMVEKEGKTENIELALRSRSGKQLIVRSNACLLTMRGDTYMVCTLDDVTDRKLTEDHLAMLKKAVDVHEDAAYWIDTDNKFVYVNVAGAHSIGRTREEMIGEPITLLNESVALEQMKAVWEKMREDGFSRTETVHRRKDGSTFPVEISATYVQSGGKEYICGFAHDISERKRLEEERAKLAEQMGEAQKMEAVGRLAGGVAHNFNNILTAIVGYCELLLAKLPADSEFRHEAEQIKVAADNAAVVTRQLLLFSRRRSGERASLDLNAVVIETRSLLRQLIRGNVKIVTSLSPDLPLVEADRSQMEQVLVDLVLNSSDAMPEGGTLTIATEGVDLEGKPLEGGLFVPARRYVTLAVSDTGIGMDEQTKALLFEPFFTTKGPDWGSGLGLATVYGIIEDSGGHIEVDSQPGEGATFKIFLPAAV